MARTMTDRRRFGVLASGVLLAMVATASASAQDAAPSAAPAPDTSADATALQFQGVITPEAQAILDRMRASFQTTKRFGLSADITRDEVLAFGYKLQHNESARMWVDAPNRLRLEVRGDIKNRTYIFENSQLTMAVPDLNVYATTPAPATIGELVRLLLDAGVEMPLIDMLYLGNDGTLTDDVRVGLVVGDSQIDGVATDHLAFRQPNVDWQLWVEKGGNSLPRKLLITTRYAVGDPQYEAILHWDLKPNIDSTTFTYVPPSGATKIPFHSDFLSRGGAK